MVFKVRYPAVSSLSGVIRPPVQNLLEKTLRNFIKNFLTGLFEESIQETMFSKTIELVVYGVAKMVENDAGYSFEISRFRRRRHKRGAT
jgi:hypothetical protein